MSKGLARWVARRLGVRFVAPRPVWVRRAYRMVEGRPVTQTPWWRKNPPVRSAVPEWSI